MKLNHSSILVALLVATLLPTQVFAAKGGKPPPPPATAGDVVCDDVNGCVDTSDIVNGAVTTEKLSLQLQQQNSQLDARLTALEEKVNTLMSQNAALINKLACVSAGSNSTELFFEGCNVHVRNGAGQTDSLNTLGNLIIGYNEDDGLPATNDRTGSHNLVVGPEHTYSSYGGFVAGANNSITGISASVSGGSYHEASGQLSSVSGGGKNTASGIGSSVSAGNNNEASAYLSSVSGGTHNTASGIGSSVRGGDHNTASGDGSSVSGGTQNTASGIGSSVSGGATNEASSDLSSVSGGRQNIASGYLSSVSGGLLNTASGELSSASGGNTNIASGMLSSVSGGDENTASAVLSSILGGYNQSTSSRYQTIPALP